jgi:hypothetical protein
MAKKKTRRDDSGKPQTCDELIAYSQKLVVNTRKTIAKLKALAAGIEADQRRNEQ